MSFKVAQHETESDSLALELWVQLWCCRLTAPV